MIEGASHVYEADDLAGLVAAASRSKGLVDTPTGSLRVMEAKTGREAARHTRDPATWTEASVHGRLLILYGPYAVAAVRQRLGEHAPEATLPHLEAEKAELRELSEEAIPYHRFHPAWRIRWVMPQSYGEGYFMLEETAIPQLWWAVAQNVIVPLKVNELLATYPRVYGEVLRHPTAWGAAGHIAWTLAKNVGDDLSGDKLYRTCMAGVPCLAGRNGTPPLSLVLWPAGVDADDGWPSAQLVEESVVMTDVSMVRAIVGKWAGWKAAHAPESLTKDEQCIMQSGLHGHESSSRRVESPERQALRGGLIPAGVELPRDAAADSATDRATDRAIDSTASRRWAGVGTDAAAGAAVSEGAGTPTRLAPRTECGGAAGGAATTWAAVGRGGALSGRVRGLALASLLVTRDASEEVAYTSDDDAEPPEARLQRCIALTRSNTHATLDDDALAAARLAVAARGGEWGRPSAMGLSPRAADGGGVAGVGAAGRPPPSQRQQRASMAAPMHRNSMVASAPTADKASLRRVVRRPTFQRNLHVRGSSRTRKQLRGQDLAPRAKSVAKARDKMLRSRCVRWRVKPSGEVVAERFPLWHRLPCTPSALLSEQGDDGLLSHHTQEFGVPLAVSLHLRFQLLCAVMLAVLALIALPDVTDNEARSRKRDYCRQLAHAVGGDSQSSAGGAAALNGSAVGSALAAVAACYDGRAVRTEGPILMSSWWRALSVGACMEFVANATTLAPSPCLPGSRVLFGARCVGTDFHQVFVPTPGAPYCLGDSIWRTWVSPFAQVGLFLLFLVYVQRLARRVALGAARAHITAANYGAMIDGLARGRSADTSVDGVGQESVLVEDLGALGFQPDEIDHIEVGFDCRVELGLQARLERLKVRESEIEAKLTLRRKLGDQARRKLKEEHAEAWAAMAAAQRQLQEIRRHPQLTTGHAFVCFKLEKRRDDLLRRFARPTLWQRPYAFTIRQLVGEGRLAMWLGGSSGPDLPTLRTAERGSAPWRGLTADVAPEPRDIYWENLASEGKRAILLTNVISGLLILLGVVLSLGTKSLEAVFSRDEEGFLRGYRRVREYGLPLLSAAIISLVNLLLRLCIPLLTKYEMHNTYVAFERAVFRKVRSRPAPAPCAPPANGAPAPPRHFPAASASAARSAPPRQCNPMAPAAESRVQHIPHAAPTRSEAFTHASAHQPTLPILHAASACTAHRRVRAQHGASTSRGGIAPDWDHTRVV